jgi:hypothetical protein
MFSYKAKIEALKAKVSVLEQRIIDINKDMMTKMIQMEEKIVDIKKENATLKQSMVQVLDDDVYVVNTPDVPY